MYHDFNSDCIGSDAKPLDNTSIENQFGTGSHIDYLDHDPESLSSSDMNIIYSMLGDVNCTFTIDKQDTSHTFLSKLSSIWENEEMYTTDKILKLLVKFPKLLDCRDNKKNNILHLACENSFQIIEASLTFLKDNPSFDDNQRNEIINAKNVNDFTFLDQFLYSFFAYRDSYTDALNVNKIIQCGEFIFYNSNAQFTRNDVWQLMNERQQDPICPQEREFIDLILSRKL